MAGKLKKQSEGAGGDSNRKGERSKRSTEREKAKKDCSDRLTNCFVLLATLIKKFTLRLCHAAVGAEGKRATARQEDKTSSGTGRSGTCEIIQQCSLAAQRSKKRLEETEHERCQLKYEKPQIITPKTSRNIAKLCASNIICCFARLVLIVSHRSVTLPPSGGPRWPSATLALPNCAAAPNAAQLGAARKKVPISDYLSAICSSFRWRLSKRIRAGSAQSKLKSPAPKKQSWLTAQKMQIVRELLFVI